MALLGCAHARHSSAAIAELCMGLVAPGQGHWDAGRGCFSDWSMQVGWEAGWADASSLV